MSFFPAHKKKWLTRTGALFILLFSTWVFSKHVDFPTLLRINENGTESASRSLSSAGASSILNSVTVSKDGVYRRLEGEILESPKIGLMEISLYSPDLNQLFSTYVRNIPGPGPFEMSFPAVHLKKGSYFLLVSFDQRTRFKPRQNPELIGGGQTFTLPNPKKLNKPIFQTGPGNKRRDFPEIHLLEETNWTPKEIEVVNLDHHWAFCQDEEKRIFGLNTETHCLAISSDFGDNWSDIMKMPPIKNDLYGLLIAQERLFAYSNGAELFEWSQPLDSLSPEGNWISRTCTPKLMHPNARLLPYNLIFFKGSLFLGEYSSEQTGEFNKDDPESGPRILRFDLDTNSWFFSGQFQARHIHGFWTDGNCTLWVSIGDWKWGEDVGVSFLNEMALKSENCWDRWTSIRQPRTGFYGVNPIGIKIRNRTHLVLAGDRPGLHLVQIPMQGPKGLMNVDPLAFAPNQNPGETVRSLIQDPNSGDLYFWSAETSKPGLYRSSPPFTESTLIHHYEQTPVILKAFFCGPYLFNRQQRFRLH